MFLALCIVCVKVLRVPKKRFNLWLHRLMVKRRRAVLKWSVVKDMFVLVVDAWAKGKIN